MAKKKDEGLTYLQVPLPQGQGYYRIAVNLLGLNKRKVYDAGVLSRAINVCIDDAGRLSATETPKKYIENFGSWVSAYVDRKANPFEPYPYGKPLCIHAFDDTLIVIYSVTGGTYADTLFLDFMLLGNGGVHTVLTGIIDGGELAAKCVTQFNAYENISDVLDSRVISKLIVLPDKKTLPKKIKHGNGLLHDGGNLPKATLATADKAGVLYYEETPESLASDPRYKFFQCVYNTEHSEYRWQDMTYSSDETAYRRKFFIPDTMVLAPKMDYATAFQSRLFGVGDGRVFVSGYNDYTNWNLDTADEYNESNAWCSAAQSNIKADADFTGIFAFKNHVVCFKKNFVHEIYNTKNPFRLVDVYSEGAIDQRTIQEVGGNLIFVSENNVLVYTGGTPKILGYELNMDIFEYAVAGTDERRYYLYCRGYSGGSETDGFFVYDTVTGVWSERTIAIKPNAGCEKIIGFSHNNKGMFMLGGDGYIYKLDTDDCTGTEWSFETELLTRQGSSSASSAYSTVNIKHIKKLQMLAEVEQGAEFKLYALYDGEEFNADTSQLVYASDGKTGVLPIRIKLRKSAHYSVKLHAEGKGMTKIYNLELYIEKGGDLYV